MFFFQCEAFNETAVMIRQPSLDIIKLMKQIDWTLPPLKTVLCKKLINPFYCIANSFRRSSCGSGCWHEYVSLSCFTLWISKENVIAKYTDW